MEKKALLILNDEFFADVLKFIFEKIDYEVIVVSSPKQAIEQIGNQGFSIIVVGRNEGTVVKSKLADILYEKSPSPKPHIIVMKEPGDMVYKSEFTTIIKYPVFFHDLLQSVSFADDSNKVKKLLHGNKTVGDNFIKNRTYTTCDIGVFVRKLKGNRKFEIKCENKKIVGFVMSGELYIIHSDLENPYAILSCKEADVVKEDLEIQEFLSLNLGSDIFKVNLRDFVITSLQKIYDKDRLLAFVPSLNKIIMVKAPRYILEQSFFIKSNFDTKWLEHKSGKISIDDILREYRYDMNKIRAIVAMYLLGMIDLTENESEINTKFDVKIKKSFLKKIMDKIRGL